MIRIAIVSAVLIVKTAVLIIHANEHSAWCSYCFYDVNKHALKLIS